jgi:hypothetical protein
LGWSRLGWPVDRRRRRRRRGARGGMSRSLDGAEMAREREAVCGGILAPVWAGLRRAKYVEVQNDPASPSKISRRILI